MSMCRSLASWAFSNQFLSVPREQGRHSGTVLPLCGPVKNSAELPVCSVIDSGSFEPNNGGHVLFMGAVYI